MKKINKNHHVINHIEKTRSKNNKHWMDIRLLSFDHSPKESSQIFKDIYKEDKKISVLAGKLTKKL